MQMARWVVTVLFWEDGFIERTKVDRERKGQRRMDCLELENSVFLPLDVDLSSI